MPNTNWSELSHLQLGRYAEYYAKMEFSSYGYDVYTSEVDDHGVDFVAKNPVDGNYYEIQVKSIRNWGYVFIPKDKMEIRPTRLVFLLLFADGNLPDWFHPRHGLCQTHSSLSETMENPDKQANPSGGSICLKRTCLFWSRSVQNTIS